MDEIQQKESRIRSFLGEQGLDAVLLSSQANFAWATGGMQNYVGIASEMGVASLLITTKKKYVITNTIEKHRIMDEELKGMGYELIDFEWFDDARKVNILKDFRRTMTIGSDDGFAGTTNVAGDIAKLRYALTDEEITRYQWLGQKSGEAVAEVCRNIRIGDSEHDIAAHLASMLICQGIMPIVRLVAVDERVYNYRHPIPTGKRMAKFAMVVLCARKYGLIASVTRLVYFGNLEAELRKKHNAVVKVDAAFISASKPGESCGTIFNTARKAYADVGYPDEWKHHHQGGPTGYAPREYRALPGSTNQLFANQAIAWNPSIAGTKSEDTIIISGGDPMIITESANWPMVSVEFGGKAWRRPDILCR
ncbi:MAG: M24 family metallopeptidase [Desulfobacterales bacterium]|nr:M24 family metallopeptidase [Desulfobacterales bacterium]